MWTPDDFYDLMFYGVSKNKIWSLFLEISQLKRGDYTDNTWLTPMMHTDESKEDLYRERLTSIDCTEQEFLEFIKECRIHMQIDFNTCEFETDPNFARTQLFFEVWWNRKKPYLGSFYVMEFNFCPFGTKVKKGENILRAIQMYANRMRAKYDIEKVYFSSEGAGDNLEKRFFTNEVLQPWAEDWE